MQKSLATNDGDYQSVDFVALSGPIIVSKQRFLSGIVIKRRNGIAQAIHTGDLIAIENDTQRTKKNYFPGRWSVAQVLAFQGTESVMVLHLRHVKEVSKEISNSKFVTEYVRVDNSLAVSRLVETDIHLDRILPISIRLLSQKVYRHGNYLKFKCEDLIEQWNFQCHFSLPQTLDGSHPAVETKPSYLQRTSANQLPESIAEALKLLEIPNVDVRKLAQRLAANYEYTDAERFQVPKSAQIETSPTTQQTKPKASRKRSEPEDEAPVDSKKRAKKQAPVKTKKRPPPAQQKDAEQPKRKASFHIALGPVCFQKRSKDAHLSFYDAITLENKWVVKVGSLVKVNFADHRESPAQILSIYRDKDAGRVLLEVRWFYRVDELPSQVELPDDLERNEIIEVDEDVSQIEPANLVQPLRLTSDRKKQSKKTLLCRYLFSMKQFSFGLSDNLSLVSHWVGQETTRIGLDCLKAFPGKIPDLLQAYGGSKVGSAMVGKGSRRQWVKEELLRKVTVAPGTVIVQKSDGSQYFEYIEWRPVAERYAARTTAKRLCKACVGDTVCIMSEEDALCEPFVGPWKLAQILAIYKLGGDRVVRLEVRICLRLSELPASVREWAPDIKANQFFESDIVQRNVLASRVLAPTRLIFKKHCQRSFEDSLQCVQCPFFFASKSMHIQSLVSHEEDSIQKGWFVQRGISKSVLAREVTDLKEGLQFCNILPHDSNPSGSELSSMLEESCSFADEQRLPTRTGDKAFQSMIACSIQPQWRKFLDTSYLLPGSKATRWKCRIGDMVAVESEEGKNRDDHCSPFTVTWNAAQIVAFRQPTSAENKQALEIQLRSIEMEVHGCRRSIRAAELSKTQWRKASVLLGPLLVTPSAGAIQNIRCDGLWGWWYPFLPTIIVVYDHGSSTQTHNFANIFKSGIQPTLVSYDFERVVGALTDNNDFTSEGMQLPLLCAFDQISAKASSSKGKTVPVERRSTIQTIGEPLHKDVKADYYRALYVEVPSSAYTPISHAGSKPKTNVAWTAKVGDLVVLRNDSSRIKNTPYIYRSSRDVLDHKFGPFLLPTTIGEIVTIRKETTNKTILEIRWFLRESEVSSSVGEHHVCEEVVETDWFGDNVSAENLVAPVLLHSHQKELQCDNAVDGLPQLEVYCTRFWSVVRKCSVPIAGLDGRIARGRLKSKRVGGNTALAKALGDLQGDTIVETESTESIALNINESWRTCFDKTIGKLSLTDAARETDDNLSAIVGREIERRKISSFVQDAVSGFRDSGKRPSLFVAGPPGKPYAMLQRRLLNRINPGTGKTAVS